MRALVIRVQNKSEDKSVILVYAFSDPSPSFARGFTCGTIWQQMRTRTDPFSETIAAELREQVIAMATAAGWREEFIELNDDWLRVTFMSEKA